MWQRVAHAVVRLVPLAFLLAILISFSRLWFMPWRIVAPLALIALAGAVRPHAAFIALAALVPIAAATAQTFEAPPFRVVEAIALAALAGWLARTSFDRRWALPVRLGTPATAFGLIVLASAAVQISVVQIQTGYPLAFLDSFLRWAIDKYLVEAGSYAFLHDAALLLEGIAVLAAAAAAARRAPGAGAGLRRALVVGATAAALLNLAKFAAAVVADAPGGTVLSLRLNVHFPDVNAAGSQFVLAATIACGLAMGSVGAARAGWAGAAGVLAAGLWLTGSHAAYAAFATTATCLVLMSLVKTNWPRAARPAVVLPLVAAGVFVAVLAAGVLGRSDGDRPIRIRADLARAAWRLTETSPVFGIGIGQFFQESSRYFTPLLRSYYIKENAHNNFLQILAELGFAGFACFLWTVGAAILSPRGRPGGGLPRAARSHHEVAADLQGPLAEPRRTPEQTAAVIGILGFLLTALSGHPLLTAESALTFWLALAAVAADTAGPVGAVTTGRWRIVRAALFAAIVLSVATRATTARTYAPLDGVTHGLRDFERGPEDKPYRGATGEATFFVRRDPLEAVRLELPLRVRQGPVPVRVDVDGRRAMTFELPAGKWQPVVLSIPPGPTPSSRVTVRAPGEFMTGLTAETRPDASWRWGDVDGDRRADLTVFRASTGEWLTTTSSSRFERNTLHLLGHAGIMPVARDYDGDAKQDPASYHAPTGTWEIARSSERFVSDAPVVWGLPGDLPVPADYDGDGRTDVAVYRPADGAWAVRLSAAGATRTVRWGQPGDIPMPADYDGDRLADFAVFRPSTGVWLIRDRSGASHVEQLWGLPGDIPVPADFDGDRRHDLAVYRRGTWHILPSGNGTPLRIDWGLPDDVPMAADYDGDGRAEPAIFRPSENRWYVREGIRQAWGRPGDSPVPRRP